MSVAENERVSAVMSAVLDKEPNFQCLQCPQTFPSYSELSQHKAQSHPKKSHLGQYSTSNNKSIKNESLEETDEDYKTCLNNALDSVPEVTFNNMHGTIRDIGSLDAQEYQSKTLGNS